MLGKLQRKPPNYSRLSVRAKTDGWIGPTRGCIRIFSRLVYGPSHFRHKHEPGLHPHGRGMDGHALARRLSQGRVATVHLRPLPKVNALTRRAPVVSHTTLGRRPS